MGNQLITYNVDSITESYHYLLTLLPLNTSLASITYINPETACSELTIEYPAVLLASGILKCDIADKLVKLASLEPDKQKKWCLDQLTNALNNIENQAKTVLSKIDKQSITITCRFNSDFVNMMNDIDEMNNIINQVHIIRKQLKLD